jgi:hypothetical protein
MCLPTATGPSPTRSCAPTARCARKPCSLANAASHSTSGTAPARSAFTRAGVCSRPASAPM